MQHSKLLSTLIIATALQGCAAAAIATVIGTASIASDNRSLTGLIDDKKIEISAHNQLNSIDALKNRTNIQVASVNGKVLVVGQAPTPHLRDQAITALKKVQGIRSLHDQIRIRNTASITTKSNDVWLTSKVKAAIFTNENLATGSIKIVTENGEVFLLGLVSKSQAKSAVDAARHINGVNRVFRMFDYSAE